MYSKKWGLTEKDLVKKKKLIERSDIVDLRYTNLQIEKSEKSSQYFLDETSADTNLTFRKPWK